MALPQTLQLNERGVAVYTDGVLQGYESIVTLTDEQLYQEQIEQDSNDAIHILRDAHDNWDTLTSNEQKAKLEQVITCMLNLYKGQY